MNEHELLPCPFCGDEEYKPFIDQDDYAFVVRCGNCSATAESFANDQKAAIEAWNQRSKFTETDQYKKGFLDAKDLIVNFIEKLKCERSK